MAPSFSLKSPLMLFKSSMNSVNIMLRFIDARLKQKYFDYMHERSLTIIKILDVLIIVGSVTVIIYLILDLISGQGYESLDYDITLIVTIVAIVVIVIFIGLSIYLHYFKRIYSDILLCIINTFSIVFLFEINFDSPNLQEQPTLYFSYCYRFGLMNLMFVICYKSWLYKVFEVLFWLVYFNIRLEFNDPYSVIYNIILTLFCCSLFYFLEKQDKLAFKKMVESEKQNKSWKKILNTFPEGIVIVKEDKNIIYTNPSIKQLLNLNETDDEKLKQVLFFQIKRKGPSVSYSKFSNESNPSNNFLVNNLKDKETSLNEIFDDFIFKRGTGTNNNKPSYEKLEKQKSTIINNTHMLKRALHSQISMKAQKTDKAKFEAFLSRLNDKVFEVKLSKFTYESSGQAYILILSDVTENFKLRMLEDNKAFKSSLFCSFTHEFRTPLNALFLLTKTLLLHDTIPETMKTEIIDPIIFNAEILHNLINTISDYAAMNMHNFKLQKNGFDFKEFMRENVRILTCLAKARNLQTELKLSRTLPDELYSDENRIKQILFQLYSNALKFTTTGSIKVSAKLSKTATDRIIISVKDSGIGISEKDSANLYKAINQQIDYMMNYERLAGSAGASLGLTVSNQIAKRLDKKPSTGIGFKSVAGKGTKFYFSIKNSQTSKKVSYLNLLKIAKNVSSKKESSFKKDHIEHNIVSDKTDLTRKMTESEEEENKIKFNKIYLFPEAKFLCPDSPKFMSSKRFVINKINAFCSETNSLVHKSSEIPINNDTNEANVISRTYKIGEIHKIDTMINGTIDGKTDEANKQCQHEPILIVDDDEFNIMAITMLLKMKNYSCLAARNGQLAIELIEEQCKIRENCCKAFSLILMDLNMPILNGIEASKRLNQSFEDHKLPWMPIIMCTAYGKEAEVGERYDSGIVEIINKPLKVEVLTKLLERWINNKSNNN